MAPGSASDSIYQTSSEENERQDLQKEMSSLAKKLHEKRDASLLRKERVLHDLEGKYLESLSDLKDRQGQALESIVKSAQKKMKLFMDQRVLLFQDLDTIKQELITSDQACQEIIPKIKERLDLDKEDLNLLVQAYHSVLK